MNRILVTLFQSKPHEEVTIVLLYRQYVRRYPQTVEILHSTMLLLYPGAGAQGHGTIAFTFHYASTLSWRRSQKARTRRYLHSTMLLLYLNAMKCSSLYPSFTFHYASTLSVPSFACPSIICPFTFHYASTLSESAEKNMNTMLIFTFHYASTLSVYNWIKTRSILIYIPLCFYFIRPERLRCLMRSQFTFHYASTLSSDGDFGR